ncbi:MAG: phosphatase PAP2 family protein [Zetaproteobacteria bacterium]|nr:MAG: phosphatase PAP2 family protein [Zetaproteobacteria bacterium]
MVQIFKHLLEVPRPAAVLDGVHALGGALYAHAFPSGHAATSGAMAGALWLAMRGRWAGLAGLLWALAAIGRVYTGAHWPLDVAVGFAIGWACAWAGTRLIPELKDPEATRRWMLWLAMAGGTALVAFHTPHPHTARAFAAAVGLGSLAAAWLGWRRR